MTREGAIRALDALAAAYYEKFGKDDYRLSYTFDYQDIYIYEIHQDAFAVSAWTPDELSSGEMPRAIMLNVTSQYPRLVHTWRRF
jgi:hypothetical protein